MRRPTIILFILLATVFVVAARTRFSPSTPGEPPSVTVSPEDPLHPGGQRPGPLSGVCITDLFSEQPAAYEAWRNGYHTFHPELPRIYDAGSLCSLSDGTILVSFSFFLSPDPKSGKQSIALFDKDRNLLKENLNVSCRTVGDFPAPRISAIRNGIAELYCASADAGLMLTQRYLFDLSRFEITEQLESTVQHDSVQ